MPPLFPTLLMPRLMPRATMPPLMPCASMPPLLSQNQLFNFTGTESEFDTLVAQRVKESIAHRDNVVNAFEYSQELYRYINAFHSKEWGYAHYGNDKMPDFDTRKDLVISNCPTIF